MSRASGSNVRSPRVLLAAITGSVVIVVGAVVMLRRAPVAPPSRPDPRPEQALVGIRGADVDSARRAEPAPVTPVEAVADLSPERQRWLAAPPAPGLVDVDAIAQTAALADARTVATQALQKAFDARHSDLRRACWKSGEVESASVSVQARFAADGSLLEVDYADDGRSPGLQACVRAQKFAPTIEPPGQELAVRATLTLP